LRKIEEACLEPECSEDDSDSESSSGEVADMNRSSVSFANKDSLHSAEAHSVLISEPSESRQNANINAAPPKDKKLEQHSSESDPNVGAIHLKQCSREKCEERDRSNTKAPPNNTSDKRLRSMYWNYRRCKPPNPWKRPPDMEQQTFERYVEEIVSQLGPVLPPNPFAVQRQPCPSAEPNCERIRSELEGLLAVVDECPPQCPPACWPC